MNSRTLRVFSVLFAAVAFLNFFSAATAVAGGMKLLSLVLGAYFCVRSVQIWRDAGEQDREDS